jgi:Fe-S-cluster-containing dehydrogenase component/DMSO reductase anchor subunit
MNALAEPEVRTLIDELLNEQQQLTAVERFARKHDHNAVPAQARYYRDLIPLSKPKRGEQYAFAVDLDICTGCKACVSACHSLNGLDEDEIWRNIGLIHGGTIEEPYQQTVTTACHHCVEPACLEGCPVRAYEKDAETGIVRHLDDQCIGCQYCVLKCPYDVPKYSEKRGIVRKCDMCHGRLSVGEAPACVQACPSGAITIRIVQTSKLIESIEPGDALLPGAFDSKYTKPTTTYTTRRSIPANARPGDDRALRLEHAHWPLIWMLVLTQVAAGIYVCAAALAAGNTALFDAAKAPLAVAGFVILNLGLGVSVLHLGRPLGAWRAFLGLRTSWMSREIFAFSFFAAPAAGLVGTSLWKPATASLPALRALEIFGSPTAFAAPLAIITAALGLLGVFCSAMIYIDTHRVFWSRELTFIKFFGTTFLLGSAGTAAVLAWTHVFTGAPLSTAAITFAIIATVIRTALFGWEFRNFRHALGDAEHPNHRSAMIVWNLRRPLVHARAVLFAGSTLFGLVAIAHSGLFTAICATLSFLLTFASQVIERYFFFTAVIAPRMPGPLVFEPLAHA